MPSKPTIEENGWKTKKGVYHVNNVEADNPCYFYGDDDDNDDDEEDNDDIVIVTIIII